MSERYNPAPGFEDEWAQDSRPTTTSEFRREGYAPSTEEDTKTRWDDYGRALGTGTLGVASAIPTLAEYATQGEVGGDTRRYLEGKSEELTQGMTPVGKRSMNAAILPTDGQESIADVGIGSSLGLQTTAALPSLIASIIPGGIAGRIAKGASEATRLAIAGGAARGSAAVMNAGDVTQQIFSTLDDMSDKELMKSPAFKGYIDSGMAPAEARKKFYTDVAGVTPFLAGGISALLAAPEAELAGRLSGGEIAKKGALKGAISMGLGEAKEEGIESGTGEFMTEQKLAEHNLGDRDWYNVLSKAVQGSAVGFGMGAGSGGVTHAGGAVRVDTVAPDQQTALQGQTGSQPAAQTVPEQPQTLDMQREALLNGQRPAMLYPKGTPELELPEGTDRLETPVGVVHYNPDLVDLDTVKQLATPDRINELEGYLQSKDQAAQQSAAQGAEPVAAVTRKNGVEVDAAVVSPDKAQEQLDILAQRAPTGSTQSVERPDDVVNGRMSAQPQSNKITDLISDLTSPSAPPAPPSTTYRDAVVGMNKAPITSQEAAARLAPGWDEEPVGNAGLNRVSPQSEPDLIQYDDGTIEEVKPLPLRGNKQPASGRSKGWMTPATEEAIQQAEANRAARNQPTPSEEPSSSVQTEAAKPSTDAVLNPETKKVKVGGWEFDVGARDAIAVKKPGGDFINFYDRDQRKHYGRRGEAYLDEAADHGIPDVLRDKLSEYLKNKQTPEQFTESLNAPLQKQPSSSVQTEATSEVTGAIKPKRARRTKEEIAADNAAKETARAAKTAAKETAKTEKARLALEAAQKRAAEKAARVKAPTKTKSENALTTVTATEPTTENNTPSGVLGPVFTRVAEKLATKNRVSAEGSHEAGDKQKARKAYAAAAEEAFYANQPGDDEIYEGAEQIDLLRPKDSMTGSRFVRSDKQRKAIRARIEKFLKSIESAGHEIPPYVTKNSNNFQLYARVAKDLLTYLDSTSKSAQEAVDSFITDEQAAFAGDFEPMRKRRLEEGDIRSRPNNELNEDTTEGSNNGVGTAAFPAPDEVEDHLVEQRISDMKNAAREIIRRQLEATKTDDASGSLDLGALYLELANDYPDVIGQFQFRSLDEIKDALTDASIEKNTKPKAATGAIKPKKTAAPAPVQTPSISKEENDRLVALMNELEANKSKPKVYTPTRDIEELGRRLSIGAAGGMTQNDLRDALLGGQFGDYISALINNGEVVIHPTDETIPGGVSQAGPIQGAVTPDGKIHLAANNLDAASANGVILHEVFHSRGQSLVGSPVWQSLMRQMSNIVSGVGNGTETGDFWVQAVRQAQAANTSPDMIAEEVAAYAVENAENATPGVRAFVARMLGAVKAWALKTFGVQFGKLTPEQLRSLAIAALRAKPMATQSATRYSISSDDLTDKVNDTKQAAKDQSEAALNKIKRFFTKAATLDQLRQMHAGLFVNQKGEDLLSKLVSVIQRMAPKAQKLREQSDALSQRFINLKKADSEMADRFAQLAIDATMANVRLGKFAVNDHLKNGGRNAQGKGRLNDLQREYQALSPDARQLYDDMAAYYRTMQNEMARNIVDNRLRQYGVTPINRKAFIDRVIAGKMTQGDMGLFKDKGQALERLKQVSQLRVIQGDYFPLMRNGKFIVTTNNTIKDLMGGHEIEPGKVEFRAKTEKQARALAEHFASEVDLPQTNWQKSPVSQANDYGFIVSVQTRGAHFFESEAEAIAWRREHAKDFDEISEVSPIRETGLGSSDLTTAQLNSLMATVRNSNYSDDEKEAMMDMLQQGSAVLMSGNRIQKRGIARRKVLGASNDFGRNVVQYGEAVSNRLAQLEFRPEIDDALKEMREIDKNTMDKLHPARTTVLNEITARVDSNVTAANEPPRWLSDLMSLTFLGRLASPMYSVINGMQPWMVTYPVLAGRYGPVRAASMLREAYGSIGFTDQAIAGIKNTYLAGKSFNDVSILNTEDVAESIREKLKSQSDGAELNKVMDMLLERGAMSEGGFELAQSIAQGRGVVGSTIAKTDRIARQLPKVVEDVNRAVSAIAAYRLARASGMSDEKARDHAFDVVMNTQGDYSNVNAPRFFSNPYLRPALQFKKYAQMMGYLLADMTHRTFKPIDTTQGYAATKKQIEERAVALKQLTAVMGVQIAMAGALSLPGIEIAKIGFMIASALGFGGGWDDEEEKLRKYADETFGKSWGEMLTRGVVSRALNMDLSQRLSLADMMTFGEPNKYDKDGLQSYLWQMATGAPGGTLEDVRHGVTDAVKGDWAAAAGRLLPVKVIADAFKAANGYSEGKVTPIEMGMNIFGVKSGRQAEQNRTTGNSIRNNEKIAASHKELTDAYLKAKSAGERVKLRAKIIEFNKTAPLRQKVFPNSLDKVRQRIEAERVS